MWPWCRISFRYRHLIAVRAQINNDIDAASAFATAI
jgi:hypothetical protein